MKSNNAFIDPSQLEPLAPVNVPPKDHHETVLPSGSNTSNVSGDNTRPSDVLGRKSKTESRVTEPGSHRSRGKWSISPLWEAKILLGLLHQQGLVGKGLVEAFEKWLPKVAGCSRITLNQIYFEQTGWELSDYILAQQADKAIRYNQLPPEAETLRNILRDPDQHQIPSDERIVTMSRQHFIQNNRDPNLLLSTNEVASLTGFKPKTIRRWVARRFINYIRVGNRLRFRRAAVDLFLMQHEVRK
jgi:excisionase family DNA binding protein